jgi:hypothetical protein
MRKLLKCRVPTSPILAFIDSRTNQAQRKAKSAILMKKEKGTQPSVLSGGPPGGRRLSAAYVYAIIVEGVVRYIGKGRNGRMYTHLIEAKRTSARCPARTAHLSPRMHRKLVEAVRAGSQIIETVIKSGLTDRAARKAFISAAWSSCIFVASVILSLDRVPATSPLAQGLRQGRFSGAMA